MSRISRKLRDSRILRRRRARGQTTTEYTLLVGLVSVPLAIMFMRLTTRFMAGLIGKIVSGFVGNYAP